MIIDCGSCKKPLSVKDDALGKQTRCPACGALTLVSWGNARHSPADIRMAQKRRRVRALIALGGWRCYWARILS
jgi:LSD1 subclass zinc finger protein